MACSALERSSPHSYRGKSEIHFVRDDQSGRLSVTIDTARLHIRSIEATEAEYDRYAALFGDKTVMEKFATGETKTRDEMIQRINRVWARRWREGDPYSAMAVFEKGTGVFVGHVILGYGDRPGEAELAGLGFRSFWNKGYGGEAAKAIVQEYAPATVSEGYFLEGEPLETIVATAKSNNLASCQILEKMGMSCVGEQKVYGASRRRYEMHLNGSAEQFVGKVSKSGFKCLCRSFKAKARRFFLGLGRWSAAQLQTLRILIFNILDALKRLTS